MQERRVVEHVIAQRVLQHRGCRYGGEQDARKGGGLQNGTTSSLRKAPRSTAPFASKSRLHTSPDPHDVPVARAVAASAAYPPVLSPLVMDISPARFKPSKKASLRTEPYRSRIVLMDGGVYDNLGLECAYKRCETLLVSDAGMALALQPTPSTNLSCHARRAATTLISRIGSRRPSSRPLNAAMSCRLRRAVT